MTEALKYANAFEAIAADAMDGLPHEAEIARLAAVIRGRDPALPAKVAEAVTLMIGWIEESDDTGRFKRKLEVLREAVAALCGV
ncbi:hypothetical protein [Azospirillum sp.]|uniref:hypothetical protein n=1 Tax=Azospirillum sp. TaxID=34012 RepID=UPI002D459614|nr:hypothetical protein [Azospirillum sp.]HYD66329.1 hypothetical protein [Azospirillum sp.]